MTKKEKHKAEEEESALNSANLLVFLFNWRKELFIICAAAAIFSSIAALVIQEKYLSSVVMFPTSTNSFGQILTEETSKENLLEFGEKEEGERLLQIINSDEIRARIIGKYNLYKHYDIDQTSAGANAKIQKEYDSNISSQMTRFGSVRVDVMDVSPDTAMFIANDIANLIDTVSNRLRNDRALVAFHYAEAEYINLLSEIAVLEDSMASLRSVGVFDYITQIEGLNEQYATSIASGQTGRAEDLRQQMVELSQYGNTYSKLETLIESSYEREATLKKRYELLKIDVNSKLSAKFTVNNAQKADKKSYPVRWLIVVMSVASVFVFSIVALLIFENIRKLKSEGRLG